MWAQHADGLAHTVVSYAPCDVLRNCQAHTLGDTSVPEAKALPKVRCEHLVHVQDWPAVVLLMNNVSLAAADTGPHVLPGYAILTGPFNHVAETAITIVLDFGNTTEPLIRMPAQVTNLTADYPTAMVRSNMQAWFHLGLGFCAPVLCYAAGGWSSCLGFFARLVLFGHARHHPELVIWSMHGSSAPCLGLEHDGSSAPWGLC